MHFSSMHLDGQLKSAPLSRALPLLFLPGGGELLVVCIIHMHTFASFTTIVLHTSKVETYEHIVSVFTSHELQTDETFLN